MKSFFKKYLHPFLLLFCLAVGLFLRMYNLNWDQGLLFHPDERNIANAVTKIHFFTQLNPGFFAYGGFSIYLYRASADMLVALTHNGAWISDWGEINLIGRFYSALFSTLTLLPLYFLAKKLFTQKVALLSCILYTFTVTSIQNAHFATTESSLTFFGVLLCLLSLFWFSKPTLIKSLLLGVVFGISLSVKSSALISLVFPASAVLLSMVTERTQSKKLLSLIPHVFLFLLFSAFFAFFFSPYSVLDFKEFATSMHYESGVATGSIPVVYTLQFTGSIPYLFQIENFVWQLGPLLTIFAVVGMIFLIIEPLRKKEKNKLIFWTYPLTYFLYVGSWHTKFLRYMLPVIPFLIIAASFLLLVIYKRFRKIGNVIIFCTLSTTMLWAVAFCSIYTQPQTRIAASVFMYQHIPTGSTILTEAWDDGLPVSVGNANASLYQEKQLDMYSTDTPQKITYLATMLSSADYISLNSRRLYGTLMRLNTLYPITSRYYQLLFAGKLGYEKVGTFSSYPQLFGWQIPDDISEETFQVYDHPKVLLFKNTNHYSMQKLSSIIQQQ